jgi:hypothetical protein
MASIYDLAENYPGTNAGEAMPVVGGAIPEAQAMPQTLAPMAAASAPMASATAAQPVAGMAAGNPQLMSLLERYFPSGNEYGAELKTAREVNSREQEAFQNMLQSAMKTPAESGPSKAEMYFRLAAAFGAPTKTGSFVESLGTAGGAASEMLKEKRTSASEANAKNLALTLEAQKLRMSGAKDELNTLRTLASEGMKNNRTIAAEMIKDYVNSGKPQSTAGKQAVDEGLTPGTPEYWKRVSEISELNVAKQMAAINATLVGMQVNQTAALLNQQKFDFQQKQTNRLTGPEQKFRAETETGIGNLNDSMSSLKHAYSLNPQTFGGTLAEMAQFKILEQTNPKDPRVLATRQLNNLLSKGAVDKLRSSFGGNPTDSERAALFALEGLDSKSQEERKLIMQSTYKLLSARKTREEKRLNEILSGAYRQPLPEVLE